MPARFPSRPSRRLASVGVALALAGTAGCYQNPDPRSWDDANAKKNFVLGCTTTIKAGGGTTTTIAIADEETCVCIFNLIKKPSEGTQGKYAIDWDDLKAYEAKQADAKAGATPPTPPKRLTQAIEECKPAGPAA